MSHPSHDGPGSEAPPAPPPRPAPPASPTPIDELAQHLARLGAESETERAVKRIVPWIASAGVHGAMIVLGFLLTWSVVLFQNDERAPVIIADFQDVRYDPVSHLKQDDQDVPELSPELAELDPMDLEPLEFELDRVDLLGAATRSPLSRFAPDPVEQAASFVGMSANNARRIVYVIDASGSMIRSFPVVVEELARSLDGLMPQQSFSVIFFQRNEALVVPPGNRLLAGTEDEKVRVLEWIDTHVIPAGRSNPLSALERALALEPDVIFLLSENITGSGEFEIDQVDLLAMLDELNPTDARTGRRRTRIDCIQFLDPDPLGTLERIAAEHGGANGYKFLDREELGLRAP